MVAGELTARSREARDETAADRIGNNPENDGDGARLLQQRRSGGCLRKNEIGLQSDELLRESMHRLRVGRVRPASVGPQITAVRPAQFPQLLDKRRAL